MPARAAVVGAALLAVSACSSGGPAVHAEQDGPLVAYGSGGGGITSMYAPDRAPWKGTFGYNLLCANDTDAELVLTGVRWTSRVAPKSTRPLLRTVAAEEIAAGDPLRYEPLFSVIGSPPRWAEPYAERDGSPDGDFSADLAGTRIDQPCDRPRDIKAGFTELVLVLEAGRRGADVDGFSIDYTRDGDPHVLEVDQRMVLCGTRTPVRFCDGKPP